MVFRIVLPVQQPHGSCKELGLLCCLSVQPPSANDSVLDDILLYVEHSSSTYLVPANSARSTLHAISASSSKIAAQLNLLAAQLGSC